MGRYHPKRLFFAAVMLFLLYLQVRHWLNDEFYTKTVKALEKKNKDRLWKQETDTKVQEILQAQGQGHGGQKQPNIAISPSTPPGSLPLPGVQTTGILNLLDRQKPLSDEKQENSPFSSTSSPSVTDKNNPPYLSRMRTTLNDILQNNTITIFSKTYCPHSSRAKTLFLKTYNIIPAPYIVELDTLTEPAESQEEKQQRRQGRRKSAKDSAGKDSHGKDTDDSDNDDDDDDDNVTIGKALQNLLAEKTGRRTVPNIVVSGKSIGGADEMVRLDGRDELAKTLKGILGVKLDKCQRRVKTGKM